MTVAQAIIGVGQTVYKRRHPDKNTSELVRSAVQEAMEDAGIGMDAIGLVVSGVAPDALAGLDHLDKSSIPRPGIPYFRVNTGGASGSSAFLAGMSFIAAGRCDAVLVVASERMGHASTAQAVFNSIFDPIYEKDISFSTISMVAMRATMMMQRDGYTLEHWAGLAARNAAAAQLNDTLVRPRSFTVADVLQSPVLAWPIHALEACPMTEGVCAVVLVAGHLVGDRNAAWVHGAAGFSDSYAMGDRIHRKEGALVDLVTLRKASRRAYASAGITDPGRQIDSVEVHAPFASSEPMHYYGLGLCNPETGPAFVEAQIEGRSRVLVNLSGGPQAANPVSAAALIRIAESALQVRGKAGRRQRDGITTAVATGQGGATQFSTCVVLRGQCIMVGNLMETPDFTTIPAKWDFEYTYFVGESAARFFGEIRNSGRIFGTRCPSCERVLVPARSFCDACYVETTEWVEVGPGGRLEIFTIVGAKFPGLPDPPFVIGYVTLDGADTAMANYVVGADMSDIDAAAFALMPHPRVVVRFKEEREGRITDFHFELVKSA